MLTTSLPGGGGGVLLALCAGAAIVLKSLRGGDIVGDCMWRNYEVIVLPAPKELENEVLF